MDKRINYRSDRGFEITIERSEKIAVIKFALQKQFEDDLTAIYLFGSWGTEFETKESDIDIAILLATKVSQKEVWEFGQDLAVKMKQNVDLLELKNASTVMRMQIVSEGKRIYCGNRRASEQYEDYVFSSYVRLNEERKGIIEDIQKRGNVYGG